MFVTFIFFFLRILCLMLCPFTPRLNLFSTGYSSDNLQTPHVFFFLHTFTIQPLSRISTTSCHLHLPPLFLTPHSSKPLTVNQQQYLIATSSTLHSHTSNLCPCANPLTPPYSHTHVAFSLYSSFKLHPYRCHHGNLATSFMNVATILHPQRLLHDVKRFAINPCQPPKLPNIHGCYPPRDPLHAPTMHQPCTSKHMPPSSPSSPCCHNTFLMPLTSPNPSPMPEG